MTLLQIAREHCANWNRDGSCLGAHIADNLRIDHCQHLPACVLGTKGRRCQYFEECVAPNSRGLQNPSAQKEWKKLVAQYRTDCNVSSASAPRTEKAVEVRHCDCGAPLLKRQRCCQNCRRERRRKTYVVANTK